MADGLMNLTTRALPFLGLNAMTFPVPPKTTLSTYRLYGAGAPANPKPETATFVMQMKGGTTTRRATGLDGVLHETLVSAFLTEKAVKIQATGEKKGYRMSITQTDDRVHVKRTGKKWSAAAVDKVNFIVAAAEWDRLFPKTAKLFREHPNLFITAEGFPPRPEEEEDEDEDDTESNDQKKSPKKAQKTRKGKKQQEKKKKKKPRAKDESDTSEEETDNRDSDEDNDDEDDADEEGDDDDDGNDSEDDSGDSDESDDTSEIAPTKKGRGAAKTTNVVGKNGAPAKKRKATENAGPVAKKGKKAGEKIANGGEESGDESAEDDEESGTSDEDDDSAGQPATHIEKKAYAMRRSGPGLGRRGPGRPVGTTGIKKTMKKALEQRGRPAGKMGVGKGTKKAPKTTMK